MWSIMVRPAIGTSGFGRLSVTGRMRVPSPAANTMAASGMRPVDAVSLIQPRPFRPSARGR